MFLHILFAVAAIQVQTPASPPAAAQAASPQEIAAARAEADALIQAGDAGDFFVNVTDGAVPEVRHRESGLVCGFEPGAPANRVMIFKQSDPRVPRGDDVGCSTKALDIVRTLYATRYPTQADRDVAFDVAVSAIVKQFQDVKPFDGDVVTIKGERAALYQSAGRSMAFRAKMDGQAYYTAVTTFDYGGWSFKSRTSAPVERAVEASLYEQLILTALSNALIGEQK